MFFSRKETRNESTSSKLEDFLNKVDKEYMMSFATRAPQRALKDYMSRECIVKVSQSVFAIGSRYFGAEKFRTTKWIKMGDEGETQVIRKEVTFDKIRVAGALSIDVADNYTEIWKVLCQGSKFLVTDIQDVKA